MLLVSIALGFSLCMTTISEEVLPDGCSLPEDSDCKVEGVDVCDALDGYIVNNYCWYVCRRLNDSYPLFFGAHSNDTSCLYPNGHEGVCLYSYCKLPGMYVRKRKRPS